MCLFVDVFFAVLYYVLRSECCVIILASFPMYVNVSNFDFWCCGQVFVLLWGWLFYVFILYLLLQNGFYMQAVYGIERNMSQFVALYIHTLTPL
jgi:hypothetical protein